MPVTLYMDVHIHGSVTQQLRRRGIDVLAAQDDNTTGLSDDELLLRSTALGRVLVTHDIRFKALAENWQRQGKPFGGLVWGHPMRLTIGQMVTDLGNGGGISSFPRSAWERQGHRAAQVGDGFGPDDATKGIGGSLLLGNLQADESAFERPRNSPRFASAL